MQPEFEKEHPEQCSGEIFFGELTETSYESLKSNSKRRGKEENGKAPVFIKRSEWADMVYLKKVRKSPVSHNSKAPLQTEDVMVLMKVAKEEHPYGIHHQLKKLTMMGLIKPNGLDGKYPLYQITEAGKDRLYEEIQKIALWWNKYHD